LTGLAPFTATASRTSALNAAASTSSPSRISIARRTFPSKLELNNPFGSFNDAPFANVSFTTFLYVSPVQRIPSCDHTGMPHFHSSTMSLSASLISVRILPSVFPRQSPSSSTLFEISSATDCPSLATVLFIFPPDPEPSLFLPLRLRLFRHQHHQLPTRIVRHHLHAIALRSSICKPRLMLEI